MTIRSMIDRIAQLHLDKLIANLDYIAAVLDLLLDTDVPNPLLSL